MKARDLFLIILRIFGIYLIKDVLISIPPVIRDFFEVLKFDQEVAVLSLFFSILVLGIYVLIVWLLLFRTNWLIAKLNLLEDLSLEPLVVNLHRSSVYTIAIIVAGVVILVSSLPGFVRHFYRWYEYANSGKFDFPSESYNFEPLIIAGVQVLLGLLLLGNQRLLVNFIESRRRQASLDDLPGGEQNDHERSQ